MEIKFYTFFSAHTLAFPTMYKLNKFYTFLFLTVVAFLSACSSDSDELLGNTNSNIQNYGIAMLEVPQRKSGNNQIFLTHATDAYGINMYIEWDCGKKSQRWTAYKMYNANSVKNWNRDLWKYETDNEWVVKNNYRDPFQPDPKLPASVRTELEHYQGSGYNRGHICPSADRLCSKEANEQTFYLSNMQPQVYGFNGGVWLAMENKLRVWNTPSFRDTLYVVKGGTIDKPTHILEITSKGLLVPKYFYMAVLCKNKDQAQGGYKAMAFWAEHKPNSDKSLKKYMISVDELEQRTGINFFPNLPDDIEQQVEANLVPAVWGFN